jgi:hypothetical protein
LQEFACSRLGIKIERIKPIAQNKEMIMMDGPSEPVGNPQENPVVSVSPPPGVALTENARIYLDQTRPWARFIAVLIFISVGMMALASFALIFIGIVGGSAPAFMGARSDMNPIMLVFPGLLYLAMSVLYIAPGIFLSRFATGIRNLRDNPQDSVLEDLLKHQKSFWRYVGILTLIAVVLMVVIIVFAIAMAFIGAVLMHKRLG